MSKKKDSLKPWLSRPAVNRSVTLPLTRPFTQRASNLNEFHPNELDPYLLFDARDSMIGTLENPTLDLDPSKPDTLNVITATRAGTATYTDVNGNIATAPANTVRVDHVDGVPMILIEPTATNHITNTDFSTWGTQNITVSSGGGFSGYPSSVITATGTGNKFFTATLSGITAGQTHTGSIFARRTNGSGRVDFVHPNSTSGSDSSNRTITTDWSRVTCQFNGSTSSGVVTQFQIRMFTEGDSLEIAIPQVEEGAVATSFIPTSGSTVTRAADDLVISGSDFSDFYNGSEGTFYLELVDRNPTIGVHSFLRGQDINRDFLVSNGAGTKMTSFDGSSFLVQDGLVIDQLSRAAVSYESGARSLSFNGSSPNDGGNNAINWASADRLQIGNGNTFIANMHVKRVIFWPYHKNNL